MQFLPMLVDPIRTLATKTIDAISIIGGVFGPGGKNRHVFFTNPQAGTKVQRGTAVSLYTS